MAKKKKGIIQDPLFKGEIEHIWQFKAYMDLMTHYDFNQEGQKPRFTLKVHPRNKDEGILLIFDKSGRRKTDNIILRYASGKDLNPGKVNNWKDRLARSRINVSCRMDDILSQGKAMIEGFPGVPRLDSLTCLGRFDYQAIIMNACKAYDEKRKELNGQVKKEQESDQPERKFVGTATSIDQVIAYFDLLKTAYPNNPDFALVFSSRGKLPLYLGLELKDPDKAGPYHVTCAFYPEKVRISQQSQDEPEKYVVNRINARMQSDKIKIEGFTNPAVYGTGVVFPQVQEINTFQLNLARTLQQIFDYPTNGDEEEVIADEDQDTKRQPAQKSEVDLPTGFENEAKGKLDDLFGNGEK